MDVSQLRLIEPWELPHLRAHGARLAELRRSAGLSQARLAEAAGVRTATIGRLERAERRPRLRTLGYIVGGLCGADARLDAGVVLAELVALVGPALAPESAHVDRVLARRERRLLKRQSRYRSPTKIVGPAIRRYLEAEEAGEPFEPTAKELEALGSALPDVGSFAEAAARIVDC